MWLFLLAVTWTYAVSPYLRDSLGCGEGPLLERWLVTVRLYGAKNNQPGFTPISLLRSHVVTPGQRDTFQLYANESWAYWLEPVNAAGAGCRIGKSVGIPPTGVAETPEPPQELMLYDLQGRRVHPPYRGGVYFTKGRRVVVIR